jgi:putative transposase
MPCIGTRKLHYLIKNELKEKKIKCGRDRLFDILRENCLLVGKKKNFTKTTNSLHRYRKFPNRIRNLHFNAPEQLWVSDITYIKTKTQMMYLALITDAVSKKIMGYNIADNMRVDSCLKALKMAFKNRCHPQRKIFHHSDRGLQYCSPKHTDVLEKQNFIISMTENHDPYENAIAERINGILKHELGLDSNF